MNPDAHGQGHPVLRSQAGSSVPMASTMPKPGPHGPLGIIFMSQGIAKVDEQTVAEILGDMPSKRAITAAQVS